MTKPGSPAADNSLWQNIASALCGVFVALCLLKFGNPVIFESFFTAPKDIYEFLYMAWPIEWGYVCLAGLVLCSLPTFKWPTKLPMKGVVIAGAIWLLWQFVAATHTVDAKLTTATLRHFCACGVCFAVGYFCLANIPNKRFVWWGVLAGLLLILKEGYRQHFGGLEETRKYFELYVAPTMGKINPDYLKKIQSNRIFGPMFYPNSFAAAILLTLPISVAFLWFTVPARLRNFIVFGLSVLSLAALAWSGAKAGWLLFVFLVGAMILHADLPGRAKSLMVGILLVGGLTVFGLKYAGFFERGATSVIARKDYWRAALQTAKEHPVFGTGPGTFAIPYGKLKAPDSEMTRLTHNDYLQQASDSGLVAAIAYFAFVIGGLSLLYRHSFAETRIGSAITRQNAIEFAVWLGLTAIGLHSISEFHLYIAGLAWIFFILLGALCGRVSPGATSLKTLQD